MTTPHRQKNGDFYWLECFDCHRKHQETESVTSCVKCSGPLIAKYDFDLIKSRINLYELEQSPISARKYLNFYPIKDFEKVISLREGGTPLIRARNLGKKYHLNKFYLKNEGANPTGVFKDRGTLVEVTKAIEMGAKAICLGSVMLDGCISSGSCSSSEYLVATARALDARAGHSALRPQYSQFSACGL